MRDSYFKFISERLSTLATHIELNGQLNLLDSHIHSENFYLHFFNLLFGYNLKPTRQNEEAIDLIDDVNKIVIQVSSQNTKQKVETALSKDILKDYPDYRFKFICISKDASKLWKITYQNPHHIVFNPKEDIYDIATILRKILPLPVEAMKQIYEFINSELGSGLPGSNPLFEEKLDHNSTNIIDLVKKIIGQAMCGWKGYDNWANPRGGTEEQYIWDRHVRLYNSSDFNADGLSSVDGINKIRDLLHCPSSSVRLVGLSGIGKTRLLQALFDERIGERPLSKTQIVYCDIGYNPDPAPCNMAERLVVLKKPVILAVDNCPPDLHKRLTSICSAKDSMVSLITIEYDVQDDQPEETEVFRLEAASTELIEKVIQGRFSHISQVDGRTIAEFSGGNARIAIALAGRVHNGDSLAALNNEELFLRLFEQRHEKNPLLLKAGEVCSLVYSFDGQTVEDNEAELKLLSALAGMNVNQLYENISELMRRDLVQKRSIWRAVLPPAIANRLAKRELENIPVSIICDAFEKNVSPRLLLSFSRRLGYLHESDAAKEIANRWLAENGLLGDIGDFGQVQIRMFTNIAPVNPELTLSAIERMAGKKEACSFFSRKNPYYNEFVRILQSLAYDSDLFERSVHLICRFALSERAGETYNSIRHVLKSLFYLKLSGTHATIEQRFKVIASLAESDCSDEFELGLFLLEAALEAWYFSSSQRFKFGAHSRDQGYSPKNCDEWKHWYKIFIDYTARLALSVFPAAPGAKKLLAHKFRGLWTRTGMYDELEGAARSISERSDWLEGWIAARETRKYDGERMNSEVLSRLESIESILAPKTLLQRAKLYAFSQGSTLFLEDAAGGQDGDEEEYDYIKIQKITRLLGRDVVGHDAYFRQLLPDILSKEGPRLFYLGQGLADGCDNPEQTWHEFYTQLSLLEESKRNYQVLRGFLQSLSEKNKKLSEQFLDEAVTDKILANVYPYLQCAVEITAYGLARIKKALDLGAAPIGQYENLGYGRFDTSVTDRDLCELLRWISSKSDGAAAAFEVLYMILSKKMQTNELSDILVSAGQEILLNYPFSRKADQYGDIDYRLAYMIKVCFASEAARNNAGILCSNFLKAIIEDKIYTMDYHDVLQALAVAQPIAVLDAFLDTSGSIQKNHWRAAEKIEMALSYVKEEIILSWCEASPERRYPLAAAAVVPYQQKKDETSLEWKPLALKMIANAINPILVLKEFGETFRPTSWSGSKAEIMQNRLKLITGLKSHEDYLVAEWAGKEEKAMAEEIRKEREYEKERESSLNERFEW